MNRFGAAVLSLLFAIVPFSPAGALSQLPGIRHVFVIVLENEGFQTTFESLPAPDPYLRALTGKGVLLSNYYGIGHHSLDNYVAMISGQGPNFATQSDCNGGYPEFVLTAPYKTGQALGAGCVYPASVPTLAGQLEARHIRWKGYMEDMGNDPSREEATCGRPKLDGDKNDLTQRASHDDQYAARHNPFVYFHAIADAPVCAENVVALSSLEGDLADEKKTPNFAFITPNLCNDGHDGGGERHCANGDPGGLVSVDAFLSRWVPKILASPAYHKDGLLVITFDEADTDDATSCCGEEVGPNIKPGQKVFGSIDDFGPGISGNGGGRIGAVLLSRFIAPGCVATSYNHYSLLRTVEDIFGVGHLGYAAQREVTPFGGAVWSKAHKTGAACG